MATTAYREHQYLNHFECSTCEGNGETATHARCPGCHGTGFQTCLLTAGCEDPAVVLSAHDEGTPACQACEDAACEDAASDRHDDDCETEAERRDRYACHCDDVRKERREEGRCR